MKKIGVYIETSVWSFLFAEDAPERKIATERFFNGLGSGRYDISISDTVILEVGGAPPRIQEKMFAAIQKYSPAIFHRDAEVNSLADAYIRNGLLSGKHYRDILHIAFASSGGASILLSWNMRHIVKRNTQHIVNIANRIHGYPDLEIWTPEGLMDYED